jgi:predicted DCC family thiol-disulfide oxidoreductase YuxK
VEVTVIYDDDCGFCRWALALLLDLDRGAMRPLPLGTPEADYLLHDLAPEERDASWHLVIDPPASAFEQLSLDLSGLARPAGRGGAISVPARVSGGASGTSAPVRFSAGAAVAPALRVLPRGGRVAWLVARMPDRTERGYRWVAGHRSLLGRFVPRRARRWADAVIAAHRGPGRSQ